MTNIVIYNNYYRGKSYRKVVKDLLNSSDNDDDDITAAKSRLDAAVIEHDHYMTTNNIVNDNNSFTSIDNNSLHHAKEHLDTLNSTGQAHQKNAAIRALEEEEEEG